MLIIFLIWFFVFANLTLSFTNKKTTTIKWNGLLWVGLDYYSIKKHNSNDKPMQLLEINKQ